MSTYLDNLNLHLQELQAIRDQLEIEMEYHKKMDDNIDVQLRLNGERIEVVIKQLEEEKQAEE